MRGIFITFLFCSSSHYSTRPAKRLWNYLVTRDYLQDVFIRYIFRKQRSMSEVHIFKPLPPIGAGGGYMFSGRPSVPLSVRASVRPSVIHVLVSCFRDISSICWRIFAKLLSVVHLGTEMNWLRFWVKRSKFKVTPSRRRRTALDGTVECNFFLFVFIGLMVELLFWRCDLPTAGVCQARHSIHFIGWQRCSRGNEDRSQRTRHAVVFLRQRGTRIEIWFKAHLYVDVSVVNCLAVFLWTLLA